MSVPEHCKDFSYIHQNYRNGNICDRVMKQNIVEKRILFEKIIKTNFIQRKAENRFLYKCGHCGNFGAREKFLLYPGAKRGKTKSHFDIFFKLKILA